MLIVRRTRSPAASTSRTTPRIRSRSPRWHGYRPEHRYIVFQALAHTVSMPATQWRVLADAHRKRNQVEYEGTAEVDPEFLDAVLRVTHELAKRVRTLGPAEDRS